MKNRGWYYNRDGVVRLDSPTLLLCALNKYFNYCPIIPLQYFIHTPHIRLRKHRAAEATDGSKGPYREGGGMLPAMEHHTAATEVRVCSIEAIKSIGDTIATLIPLGNKGTTHR